MRKLDTRCKRAYELKSENVEHASRTAVLILADCVTFLVCLCAALLSAMAIRYILFGALQPPVPSDANRIFIVFGAAFVILIFRSITLGHYTQFCPFWIELKEVIKTVLVIAAFVVFLLFAIGVQFSRLWFGFFLIFLFLLVPYGREKAKIWMIKKKIWYQPTYIIGTGANARRTAKALISDSSLGHNLCGFIRSNQTDNDEFQLDGIEIFNSVDQARKKSGNSTTLVFAFETLREMEAKRDLINKTIAESAQVLIVPPGITLPLYGASLVGIFRHDTALLKIQNRLADPTAQLVKRCVDFTIGILLLVALAPVFLLLSMVIRRDGGPAFFNHKRLGKNGEYFSCHKFRSMFVNADAILEKHLNNDSKLRDDWNNKRKLVNDPRVTKIGRYLRRTSIDELPQLINVIKGEMSLVGPRPIVDDEARQYGAYLTYYLTMTPGMSGLWQVSGRTDTTYEERVRLDVWYCKNWTLWIDIVVLIKTFKTLLNRHGAY